MLAALPRTRPQRASARRAAARGKASKSETAAAGMHEDARTAPRDDGKRSTSHAREGVAGQPKVASAPTSEGKAARKSPSGISSAQKTQRKTTRGRVGAAQSKKTEPRAGATHTRAGHPKRKPSPPSTHRATGAEAGLRAGGGARAGPHGEPAERGGAGGVARGHRGRAGGHGFDGGWAPLEGRLLDPATTLRAGPAQANLRKLRQVASAGRRSDRGASMYTRAHAESLRSRSRGAGDPMRTVKAGRGGESAQ